MSTDHEDTKRVAPLFNRGLAVGLALVTIFLTWHWFAGMLLWDATGQSAAAFVSGFVLALLNVGSAKVVWRLYRMPVRSAVPVPNSLAP